MADHLRPQFEALGVDPLNGPPLERLITVQSDRVKTLKEMAEISRSFYEELNGFDPGSAEKHLRLAAELPLRAVAARLAALDAWEPERLDQAVRLTAEELEMNLGKVAQPLRVALTGTGVSPSIDKTLWLTGRERSLARIAAALQYVKQRVPNP